MHIYIYIHILHIYIYIYLLHLLFISIAVSISIVIICIVMLVVLMPTHARITLFTGEQLRWSRFAPLFLSPVRQTSACAATCSCESERHRPPIFPLPLGLHLGGRRVAVQWLDFKTTEPQDAKVGKMLPNKKTRSWGKRYMASKQKVARTALGLDLPWPRHKTLTAKRANGFVPYVFLLKHSTKRKLASQLANKMMFKTMWKNIT